MIGQMTPPNEKLNVEIPSVIALLLFNHSIGLKTIGVNKNAEPIENITSWKK
jgi:hypothetical protein